jgi:hypothetical protein
VFFTACLGGLCGQDAVRSGCHVQTDIKEAVFLGEKDELVACGCDDGLVFIYRADTGARLVCQERWSACECSLCLVWLLPWWWWTATALAGRQVCCVCFTACAGGLW